MKNYYKSVFSIFTYLTILITLLGALPASSARAESRVSPLYSSGDFLWAKDVGGTGYDEGLSIVADSADNIYTTGNFADTVDFDPSVGISNLTSEGNGDIFVSKSDSNGGLVWAKSMGGLMDDFGLSTALDSSGNIYITGGFGDSVDFDPGASSLILTGLGFNDIFVSKLDNDGNFVWAKNMGGTGNEYGISIALDSSGNIYITGFFDGTVDFDPGLDTFNITSAGAEDIFVAKLDSDGNFVWAKTMGGLDSDYGGRGITIDSNDNVYTTGTFYGTVDFDPGLGTFNITSAGAEDIFISKLDENGNFVWAKSMGGTEGMDAGQSITVDASDNIYVTGAFWSIIDFDPGPDIFNMTSAGGEDIFISKLDSNGNFIWAKRMGGTDYDHGYGIAVDSSENVYTAGYFGSVSDFNPGTGTFNISADGSEDIFISKLDNNGNFVWAKGIGGTEWDGADDLALDSNGNIYTTGEFQLTSDFDTGAATANLTSAGDADIFISKLENSIGNVAPTLVAIVRAGSNPTSVSSVNFTVTFSESVLGVDMVGPTFDDFSLTTSGVSGPSVNGVSGSGDTYTVTVNTGTSNGTVRLDVVDNDTITDQAFSPLNGPGTGADFTSGEVYAVVKSPTFADVLTSHSYWEDIEILYANGLTAGCSVTPLDFCPDQIMDRAQSAVFNLRGNFGISYTPPLAPWDRFADDWSAGAWAERWAEGMYNAGLTAGCATSPLRYCPWDQTPKVQAAVFGLRLKYGNSYVPPAASGTVFADMTDTAYFGTKWSEQAYADGLLPDCGIDIGSGKPNFCPDDLVSRGLGADMIVKAKNLSMP
jgi:Beta-propeller repeat